MKKQLVKAVVKQSNLQVLARQIGDKMSKNSPTILTGLGVAGIISTTIMAVKATPKALTLIDDEYYNRYDASGTSLDFAQYVTDVDNNLTKKEILKLTWKEYIPTAVMGTVTVACFLGANNINLRRNAALASVYSITEATLKEYQAKVVDTIGAPKEQKIKDEINQDNINRNPVSKNEVIFTGKGETLCYDKLSGRYFKNDLQNIRRVINDLNHNLRYDMWTSVNELYYGIGLGAIDLGSDVGWDVDFPIDVEFSTTLSENDVPCVVLDFRTKPFSC